jgi:hypothetical protein
VPIGELISTVGELEKQIIAKRDVKIWLNEEIEDVEEELEEVERSVAVKRDLHDEMRKQIDIKTMKNQMTAYNKMMK